MESQRYGQSAMEVISALRGSQSLNVVRAKLRLHSVCSCSRGVWVKCLLPGSTRLEVIADWVGMISVRSAEPRCPLAIHQNAQSCTIVEVDSLRAKH